MFPCWFVCRVVMVFNICMNKYSRSIYPYGSRSPDTSICVNCIFDIISGLYHPNAVLTMSSNFIGIADHKTKNLNFYMEKSRSFFRTVNPKPLHNLFQGPAQIVKLFGNIGNTEHDFKSFTIDLISYTVRIFIINITHTICGTTFFSTFSSCSQREPRSR